ncbi:MAG: GNAT family N-acetyltransferase [Acetobacteraceae bacterium]|nr:GNAT family N-acetyltransferase [Acetobacteraceae bacterium]
MSSAQARSYPRTFRCDGGEVEIRYMAPADQEAVLGFARALPGHDLLFLPRDITQPKVLAAWAREIESGSMLSLLGLQNGKIVGCATLVRDPLSWSSHVGELRVVVSADMRGKGLGRLLIQECFGLALDQGLEKITAQMTVDQRGAINVFETIGFRAEGLLRDQVKDRNGNKFDIAILSHDARRFQAQAEAYGLTDADSMG